MCNQKKTNSSKRKKLQQTTLTQIEELTHSLDITRTDNRSLTIVNKNKGSKIRIVKNQITTIKQTVILPSITLSPGTLIWIRGFTNQAEDSNAKIKKVIKCSMGNKRRRITTHIEFEQNLPYYLIVDYTDEVNTNSIIIPVLSILKF